MMPKRKGGIRLGIKFGGLLLLSLAVLFALGGCAWIREWLNPNHAPVAVIRANPTSGEAPLEVFFDASESYDPDGDEISYEWDFGDDQIGHGQMVQHTFTVSKTYTVRLTVLDKRGGSGTSTLSVTVFQMAVTGEVGEQGLEVATESGTSFTCDPGVLASETPVLVGETNPEQILEGATPIGDEAIVEIPTNGLLSSSRSLSLTHASAPVIEAQQGEGRAFIELPINDIPPFTCAWVSISLQSQRNQSCGVHALSFGSNVKTVYEGFVTRVKRAAGKARVEVTQAIHSAWDKIKQEGKEVFEDTKLVIRVNIQSLEEAFKSYKRGIDGFINDFLPRQIRRFPGQALVPSISVLLDIKPSENPNDVGVGINPDSAFPNPLPADGQIALVLVHGFQFSKGEGLSMEDLEGFAKETWAPLVTRFHTIASFNGSDRKPYRIYAFLYDPFRPVTENGEDLAKWLSYFTRHGNEIVIVAHSMGGLVARSAIEEHGAKVAKLITLGTPHLGTPLANKPFETLEVSSLTANEKAALVGLLLIFLETPGGHNCAEPFYNKWLAELNRAVRREPPDTDYIFYGSRNPGSNSVYSLLSKSIPGEDDGLIPYPSAVFKDAPFDITRCEFNNINHSELRTAPVVLESLFQRLSRLAPDRAFPTVTSFSVNQDSVTLGSAFTISFSVADTGGSGLNRVELWRANDDEGTPIDWKEIQRVSISGDTYTGSLTDSPPAAGTYWYGLHVVDNAGNSNDERNSNTNGSPGVYGPIKVQVVSEKPDLTITAVSPSESAVPTGGKILVTFTVENQGPPIMQEFKASVFLSNRQYLGGRDILLKEVPMVLNGDIARTETVEVTVPQMPPGDWYLAVYVDAGEDVEESNENNNIDSVPITVTASQPSQVTLTLYVHEESASGSVIVGARVRGHDAAGNPFDKTTNSSGYVTITGAPGTWHFVASKDGYREKSWDWEVTQDETRSIFLERAQQENQPPIIESLVADPPTVEPGGQSRISVSAYDPDGDPLSYTWSAIGGRLSSTTGPRDKTWTAPSTPGTYQVTVSVTDNKPGHSPVSRSVDLTVVARLTITTVSLPAGQVGQSYRATLRAAGGTPPYRWSIKAGSLPSGLSLDPTTGVISGAPAESGTFHFTVQVRDSTSQTVEEDFSISISSSVTKPRVSTDSATDIGETSATLKGFLDSTGGEECQVWFEYGTTTSYGHSTPKQTLNTAGPFSAHISGLKPNTTYHFKACASNSRGTICGEDVTFRTKAKIDQLPQIMRPQESEVFQAEVGKVFTLQIEAQDPEGQKLVYMLTEWPSSLTLDRDTGLIQWTPTVDFAGKKVKVTFYVSDRPIGQTAGREVYRTFYIEVQEKADTTPPTVVATNPTNNDLGAPITDTITVTFSEEIRRSTGSITIIDENKKQVAIQATSVSGRVLTIRLANRLAYSTGYAVDIGAGVVIDLAGNPNPEYSWTFCTRAPQAPPRPTLVAPPNGATVSTTPTLQWNPVSGAEGYAVQVARDTEFSDKVFNQVVLSTSVQVSPALDAGSRYFWRVAAMGEGESISSWSDVWSFTTQAPSLPDLVVEDIWTEPSPPIASEYTTIGVKIRNQGERDVTGTIYLELFFDGVSKGRASINGLAAGATRTSKWQTMEWPSDTNYHTVRCIVDPNNIVTESNESNNARSEQFKANRLTFTKLWPTTIETSESTYQATLYATGSNFLNVTEVSFSWSGPDSDSRTWRKGDPDWNAGVEVRSDSSMVLKPRVLFNWRSTQRKEWHWTVTLKDNTGATASQSFTVIYNPPGPPKITSASPSPNSTAPGRTITITYEVTNPGSARQVLLGASIRLSGGPTLSDPANDIKVTLPSGSSSVSRRFTVATTAPLGTYDLLVSIVEDTNNNGKIDSSDQLLDFATFDDVLQLVKFSKGDAVEVYNTGGKGLLVLDAPCGKKIGAKFDGETGTILKGPVYCAGYNRWQIRWSDGLVGWSAEKWLRLLE